MKKITAALLCCLSILCGSASAMAAYPDHPITVICPFGAGSGSDRIFRTALPYIKEALGVDVVIDYKAGGGGVVGSNYFMTVKPDGYTLLFYTQPHISLQERFTRVAFGNSKLAPVLGLSFRPDIITVREDSPFKSFQDLLDYAKANPGKLTIGNTGSFSINHLTYAQLVKDTQAKFIRVPFENGGKMNAALLGGQIDACISNMQWLAVYPGKIRALATSAAERPTPDLPTFKEMGYPGMVDLAAIDVLCARSDVPEDILNVLREKLAPLSKNEQLKADFEKAQIDYGAFDWKYMENFISGLEGKISSVEDVLKNTLN